MSLRLASGPAFHHDTLPEILKQWLARLEALEQINPKLRVKEHLHSCTPDGQHGYCAQGLLGQVLVDQGAASWTQVKTRAVGVRVFALCHPDDPVEESVDHIYLPNWAWAAAGIKDELLGTLIDTVWMMNDADLPWSSIADFIRAQALRSPPPPAH